MSATSLASFQPPRGILTRIAVLHPRKASAPETKARIVDRATRIDRWWFFRVKRNRRIGAEVNLVATYKKGRRALFVRDYTRATSC